MEGGNEKIFLSIVNKQRTSRFVEELRQQDVLLGRGTGPNEHQGNRMFRLLAKEAKDAYTSCTSRSGKDQLVRNVIQAVHDRGGRFLKKGRNHMKKSPHQSKDIYEVADEPTVMEKTRQVFQYYLRKRRTPSMGDNSSKVKDNERMPPAVCETNAAARVVDHDNLRALLEHNRNVAAQALISLPQEPAVNHSSSLMLEEVIAQMSAHHRAINESRTEQQQPVVPSVVHGVFPGLLPHDTQTTTIIERALLSGHILNDLLLIPTRSPHHTTEFSGNPHNRTGGLDRQTPRQSLFVGRDRWPYPHQNHLPPPCDSLRRSILGSSHPVDPSTLALTTTPPWFLFFDPMPDDSRPQGLYRRSTGRCGPAP